MAQRCWYCGKTEKNHGPAHLLIGLNTLVGQSNDTKKTKDTFQKSKPRKREKHIMEFKGQPLKYIMYQMKGFTMPLPFIFPAVIAHNQFDFRAAKSLISQALNHDENDFEIVSAGFINIDDCYPYGESESLQKKSDTFDEVRFYNSRK